MKKRRRIKDELVTALELPYDLAYHDAIITITGSDLAVIENYRRILRYTNEEIVLGTLRGTVTIKGKCLEIPCYTALEMQIKGKISEVFLNGR